MGTNMSSMGVGLKGASMSQALRLVTDKLYDQIVEKEIEDFPGFHHAILEIFSAINMALPGKHYDPPSLEDVTDLFDKCKKEADGEKRRKILIEFMEKNVNVNKVDQAMIITAIVAPPAAMVAKRTGQTLPQLKLMKSVPDVLFVPSATVLALAGVKIVKYMFMGKTKSKDEKGPQNDEVQHSDSNNIPETSRAHDQKQAQQHDKQDPRPQKSL